jgi:hypothetical protein
MMHLIAVGGNLPRVSFARVDAPGTVSWNQGTTASVIFAPHLGSCADCARYLGQLAEAAPGLREWATRAMVLVSPERPLDTSALDGAQRSEILLLADERAARRVYLGVGDHDAAVVLIDRWGAVFAAESVGANAAGHAALPSARDLVALAQFIDIQCPECGVPSKEWLSATAFPLG